MGHASIGFVHRCIYEVHNVLVMRNQEIETGVSSLAGSQEQLALRSAFGRFATGVTVITTRDEYGKAEGLTANSFGSLSMDPPLVLWNLQKTSQSLPRFCETDHFAVNVLASSQRSVAEHFARPAKDKFEAITFRAGAGGCPVLPGSLAVIECKTVRYIEAGDHVIFIGEVIRFSERDGKPLIFSGGKYRQLSSVRET